MEEKKRKIKIEKAKSSLIEIGKKFKEFKKKKKLKDEKKDFPFKTILSGENVIAKDKKAFNLYNQSHFGEIKEKKVYYSLIEALYLLEKGRISVYYKRKKLNTEKFLEIATEKEPNFLTRYTVFKDIRDRGYIVKTALKFGADFRVYDRGIKPGQNHAKWVLFPVYETSTLTWHEFAAKNRVAHSTRQNLLIAIVDEEGDVTYYTVSWIKP